MEAPDGSVLFASHKGYTKDDVLNAIGLAWTDLFPDEPKRPSEVDAYYEYTDQNGRPEAFVERLPGKRFRQGSLVNGEKVFKVLKPLPIYHWVRVRQAIQDGETIYVVEGEKDADALWRAGVPATTKAGGAGSKWTPRCVEALYGANVAIIADKDKPGYAAAVAAYNALSESSTVVGIFESKEGKDASDHLAAGYGVDDLVPLTDLIPREETTLATVTHNGSFEAIQPSYIVKPYFPRGKVVLVDGDGGTFKSSFVLSLAAQLSAGLCAIGPTEGKQIRTLYLYQDADTDNEYEQVYRANGGLHGWISYYGSKSSLTKKFADKVIETIKAHGFDLVVFDPLLYFFAGISDNLNDAKSVLPGLQQANRIVEETNACGIAIRHTAKGKIGKNTSDYGMGSVQFRNSCRGQLVLQWDKDRTVVSVSDEKGSILTPRGRPFKISKGGMRINYHIEPDEAFERYDLAERPDPFAD